MENTSNNNIKEPTFIGTKLLHKGRFLSMVQHQFEKENPSDPKNPQKINWEGISFNIAMEHKGTAAVDIMPIIKSTPRKIILIANFRYPVNKFVLEFPAGLIDYNEDTKESKDLLNLIKETASRELKEETGYEGKFKCFYAPMNVQNNLEFTNLIYGDPWKTTSTAYTVIYEIEGNKGTQKLDNEELIKVFEVEMDNLLEFITEKVQKENYGVTAKLYSFAAGLELNKII